MEIIKYNFDPHGDERGQLVAIEGNVDIPFNIKRVYYMYNTGADMVRGKHAHKCLEQILICIHGSCTICLDDGKEKANILLDKPNEGLYVTNCIWREMYNFSSDAVLMVLASEQYNESDYIRDYNAFLEYIAQIEE